MAVGAAVAATTAVAAIAAAVAKINVPCLRARDFFYIGLDFAEDFSKIENSLSATF